MQARTLDWVPLDDGAAMPTLTFGPADGPPVVVLPGLSDGCAPLSDRDIRADVPPPPHSLRGYRVVLTSYRHPIAAGITTADLARDVAALLDNVTDGGPVTVTGHSMGGMVAQHLAADRPDLVVRLVLSATTAVADESVLSRLEYWDELIGSGRDRDFVRDAVEVSYTGAELRARRLLARLASPPDLSSQAARHLALSRACRGHDARHVLGAIRTPTLVLAGRADPLMKLEAVRDLARRIPDARMVELDRIAHGIPEQGRRRYLRALIRFLGEPVRQERA